MKYANTFQTIYYHQKCLEDYSEQLKQTSNQQRKIKGKGGQEEINED